MYDRRKQEISRQLADAEQIIRNVENGVFPARRLHSDINFGLDRLKLNMFAVNRRREFIRMLLRCGNRDEQIDEILDWNTDFLFDIKRITPELQELVGNRNGQIAYLREVLGDC